MEIEPAFLKNEKIKKWVLHGMTAFIFYCFIQFGMETYSFYDKFDKNKYLLTDRENETQVFDLTQLPQGKIVSIMGVGYKDIKQSDPFFQYSYYQVSIFNLYENKIYRLTVPVYVAAYLHEVNFVQYHTFRIYSFPDSIKR